MLSYDAGDALRERMPLMPAYGAADTVSACKAGTATCSEAETCTAPHPGSDGIVISTGFWPVDLRRDPQASLRAGLAQGMPQEELPQDGMMAIVSRLSGLERPPPGSRSRCECQRQRVGTQCRV